MKRMFDKEEIVEIAKEEGGSVVVDSELSPTSENPVQNKVIYEALQNGSGKYLHIINCLQTSRDGFDFRIYLVTDSNSFFSKASLNRYLIDNFSSNPIMIELISSEGVSVSGLTPQAGHIYSLRTQAFYGFFDGTENQTYMKVNVANATPIFFTDNSVEDGVLKRNANVTVYVPASNSWKAISSTGSGIQETIIPL